MARSKEMELKKKLRFTIRDIPCLFRSLLAEDVTERYVHALKRESGYLLNNPEDINLKWQQEYIENISLSSFDTICGLFMNSMLVTTTGIQNIKKDEKATIGMFII